MASYTEHACELIHVKTTLLMEIQLRNMSCNESYLAKSNMQANVSAGKDWSFLTFQMQKQLFWHAIGCFNDQC